MENKKIITKVDFLENMASPTMDSPVASIIEAITLKHERLVNEVIMKELYKTYKESGVTELYIIDKEQFEDFVKEMLPIYLHSANRDRVTINPETRGKSPNFDEDKTYHTTYKCPNCDSTIHLDWHEPRNYCPVCGCKLNWERVNKDE